MTPVSTDSRDRSAPAHLTVPQSLLREYADLERQQQRLRQLREEILTLLDAEAEIEPGPLTAEGKTIELYRITRRTLTEGLGLTEEVVEAIRGLGPPVVQHRLRVGPVDSPTG